MKDKLIILFISLIIIIILLIWLKWENNSIVITNIKYTNSKIPNNFNGYKILQISDLHSKKFGNNQEILINKVKKCVPDIIVITGDIIDSRHDNFDESLEIVMDFIKEVASIIPTYYVVGNHEIRTKKYKEIKQQLVAANVIVLDNENISLIKDDKSINLIGLADPSYSNNITTSHLNDKLKKLLNHNSFNILLSHRPELIDIYKNNNIDLVFTGHTHGGQIRLPLIGGILAPGQGLFPKYIDGTYLENNTTMIVNRGLGTSVVPIRLFNRPEIILLEL